MTRRASALVGVAALLALAVGLVVAVLVSSSGGQAAQRAWSEPEAAPIPADAVPTATAIVDPAGRVHVVFTERRGGTASLLEVVREPGGTWSAPTRIVSGRPFSIAVAGVAADARGDAAVIWSYGVDRRQVLMASTRRAAGRWSPEQAVSRVSAGIAFGQIGMDASGTTTIIGRGFDGPGLWAVRRVIGGPWGQPRLISPHGVGTDVPILSLGAGGRIEALALIKVPGLSRSLWSRAADAAGRWGPAGSLPGSQLATGATLTAVTGGFAVASWTRGAERLGASRTRSGPWSAPVVLDDVTPEQAAPSAAFADRGGASIVWTRWDGRPEDRAASIRVRRIPADPGRTTQTIASLRLAPVDAGPGRVTLYGSPPVELRATSGPEPALMWSATSADRAGEPATISVATRGTDGSWSAPDAISTPGRLAIPIALGASAEGTVAVWFEGTPMGPANRLLVSRQ